MQGCPQGQMVSVVTAGHQLICLSPVLELVPWEVCQETNTLCNTAQNGVTIKKRSWWRWSVLLQRSALPGCLSEVTFSVTLEEANEKS